MTTRLTSIFALLASGFLLAACQDDGGDEATESETSTEESESGSDMSSGEETDGGSESQ